MGDIVNHPTSLTHAKAALDLIESFKKLIDESGRKKIADDIKSFHALNEEEEKKYAEAREMIKKHQSILNDTKKLNEKIEASKKESAEKDEMAQARLAKALEVEAANKKEKEVLDQKAKEVEQAQKIHEQSVFVHKKEVSVFEKEKEAFEREKAQFVAEKNEHNLKIEKLKQIVS